MVLVDAKDNIVVDVAGYSQKTKAHVNMVSNDNHKLQIRMGWLAIVLQIHKFHLVRLLDVKYIVSVYTTYILTITYITIFFSPRTLLVQVHTCKGYNTISTILVSTLIFGLNFA